MSGVGEDRPLTQEGNMTGTGFAAMRGACLAAMAAALFYGAEARAQEVQPPERQAAQPTPAQDGSDSGEIVVTARKVNENVQDVPIAITAISGESLARQNVRSLYDLQSQVPNFVLQRGQIDTQALFVSIRGQVQNDTTSNLDPSVGIYFDGIYYPRTIGLAGQLLDVERVEVLRGPQGTLYGRNTTGGALTIFTRNPTNELGASMQLTGGSFDHFNAVGILNVPITEGLAARFVAQRGVSDGFGRDAARNRRGDEDSLTLRGRLRADLGNGAEAVLTASYARNYTGGGVFHLSGLSPSNSTQFLIQVAREGGFGTTPAGLAAARALLESYIAGDPFVSNATRPQFSDFSSRALSLNVTVPISDSIDIRSLTGYQTLRRKTSLNSGEVPFTIVVGRQETDSYYLSEELQLVGETGPVQWVAGFYGGYENALEISDTTLVPNITSVNPRNTRALIENTSLSLFAQATWEFLPETHLTGGFRYSWDTRAATINNRQGGNCTVPAEGVIATPPGASQCGRRFELNFSRPSWLISLDRQLVDGVLVYAKVSRGYRSGGVNYRGASSIDTFASFAPETVTEYEAGIKTELLDRRVVFNLAGFYDNYRNIQRTATIIGPVSGLSTSIITNAARGRIYGFEAELRVRPTQNLTLSGSVGLTDARYTEFVDLSGNRTNELFPTPKWTASASANYVQPIEIGSLTFSLNYRWQSYINLQPNALIASAVSQDAYGLLDGRVSLNIAGWDLDIAAYARNIADVRYRAAAIGNDRSLGFDIESMGRPREFGITITKRFGAI
jgi:iron complex outermembrane receptor protein